MEEMGVVVVGRKTHTTPAGRVWKCSPGANETSSVSALSPHICHLSGHEFTHCACVCVFVRMLALATENLGKELLPLATSG